MKKLMVTMAAVAMACAANARPTWQFSNVDNPDSGYAYILEGGAANSIGEEFQLYISSGDSKYYNSAMSCIKYDSLESVSFDNGNGSGTFGGFSEGDSYAIVFLDNSTAPTKYMVSDWEEYGWNLRFDMSGKSWTALPEPTSGLLMLLGMAGLALKRKRA